MFINSKVIESLIIRAYALCSVSTHSTRITRIRMHLIVEKYQHYIDSYKIESEDHNVMLISISLQKDVVKENTISLISDLLIVLDQSDYRNYTYGSISAINTNKPLSFIPSSAKAVRYFWEIGLETWSQTSECYLDTIEAFPDEIKRWEERNLKYIAYLVIAWDLLGYCRYFLKTMISNAIATKRVSS